MQTTIDSMVKMQDITAQMTNDMHIMVGKMKSMTMDIAELRDHMADFEDFFRPIRSYFYWEKHCFDIPVCWSLRSVFDALDGIDTMTDDIQSLLPDHGSPRHSDAAADRVDARDDPEHEEHEDDDADDVLDPKGLAGSADGAQQELERDGQGVRRVQKRRLVLPAAGDLQQPRIQAGHEEFPVP